MGGENNIIIISYFCFAAAANAPTVTIIPTYSDYIILKFLISFMAVIEELVSLVALNVEHAK